MPRRSNTQNAFNSPIYDYRIEKGISRANLAAQLGVHSATILRWESGLSRPSQLVLEQLKSLHLSKESPSRIMKGSVSRLSQHALAGQSTTDTARELEKQAKISLNFDRKAIAALPSPWVRNGPPDQSAFHQAMIEMQLSGLRTLSSKMLAHRYSMLQSLEECGDTYQFRLERPKPFATSWNSNYGSHGWHRYVGRFPPHVIRSLLNRFGANASTVVCDPFLGSGTTAVECRLLGIPFVGIEICPLSCLMSRTKSNFPVDTTSINKAIANFEKFYSDEIGIFLAKRSLSAITHNQVLSRPGNLISAFQNIEKWFATDALLGASIALQFGMGLKGFAKDAFLLALSAKMRSIGNVDVDVVRAEYSRKPRVDVDVGGLIVRHLKRMVRDIDSMVESHESILGAPGTISIKEGSVLDIELAPESIDHVITSPPYGIEVISYLRTHLLSYRTLLCELDHDPYDTRDKTIGSEYTPETQSFDAKRLNSFSPTLEKFFNSLVVDRSLEDRKIAMMKFFDDLYVVGKKLHKWLKKGGCVAFILGNKKLGTEIIPADRIVVELFVTLGFIHEESIRHKLKTNNSNSSVPWQDRIIEEETILLFRKRPLRT